jgi:hypothetical protein
MFLREPQEVDYLRKWLHQNSRMRIWGVREETCKPDLDNSRLTKICMALEIFSELQETAQSLCWGYPHASICMFCLSYNFLGLPKNSILR